MRRQDRFSPCQPSRHAGRPAVTALAISPRQPSRHAGHVAAPAVPSRWSPSAGCSLVRRALPAGCPERALIADFPPPAGQPPRVGRAVREVPSASRAVGVPRIEPSAPSAAPRLFSCAAPTARCAAAACPASPVFVPARPLTRTPPPHSLLLPPLPPLARAPPPRPSPLLPRPSHHAVRPPHDGVNLIAFSPPPPRSRPPLPPRSRPITQPSARPLLRRAPKGSPGVPTCVCAHTFTTCLRWP